MAEQLLYKKGDNKEAKVTSIQDVPELMRAVVALGRGEDKKPLGYEFRTDYSVPKLGEGEVLVKVYYSGMCHTDLYCLDGILVKQGPRIPGHEFSGEIVAIGNKVPKDYLRKKVVALALYGGTGAEPNLSKKAVFTGVRVDGGFAEYFKIQPEYLMMIPDGVTEKEAFPAGDALLTSRHVVNRLSRIVNNFSESKGAVIGGFGGLGLGAANNLIGYGINPKNLILVDNRPDYEGLVKDKLGVNVVIIGKDDSLSEKVLASTGGQVDWVIDCVAKGGNPKKAFAALEGLLAEKGGIGEGKFDLRSYQQYLTDQFETGTIVESFKKIIRKGGALEVIGSTGDKFMLTAGDPMQYETNINGPWGGNPWDAQRVLELIKRGKETAGKSGIPPAGLELLLGTEYRFDEEGFKSAVESVRKGGSLGRNYFVMI